MFGYERVPAWGISGMAKAIYLTFCDDGRMEYGRVTCGENKHLKEMELDTKALLVP